MRILKWVIIKAENYDAMYLAMLAHKMENFELKSKIVLLENLVNEHSEGE